VPSGPTHDRIAISFGFPPELVRAVNRYIDAPVKEHGASHRKFRHDYKTALELGSMFNDPRATFIAMLHYQLDANAEPPQDRAMYPMYEVVSRPPNTQKNGLPGCTTKRRVKRNAVRRKLEKKLQK
jgi:hypothetical protein